MSRYSDSLAPEEQVSSEEEIAAVLFEHGLDEEDSANLGRRILHLVLSKFRPDLLEEG